MSIPDTTAVRNELTNLWLLMTLNKLRRSRDPRCALEFLLDDSLSYSSFSSASRQMNDCTAVRAYHLLIYNTEFVRSKHLLCVISLICLFYSSSRCAERY